MVKPITIKLLCVVVVMLSLAISGRTTGADNPTKLPNIVFVFADDLGWGDPRCYNPESRIPTPNIDRLATEGMRFTDAHSSGSTCAPSRFGLMTGRSPVFWDYYDVTGEAWNCLTMPQLLQDVGYHTVAIGKWHFTAQFEGLDGESCKPSRKRISGKPDASKPCSYGPVHHGFNYFFGTLSQPAAGMHCNMENSTLLGNPQFAKGRFVSDDFDIHTWFKLTTTKAIEQIEKQASNADKPFFVYYAMNAPHTPIIPNNEFLGQSGAGEYGDYCCQVDWSLGEIRRSIQDAEIAENTILIFSSDNGSVAPRESGSQVVYPGKYDTKATPLHGHAANANWRGIKGDVWEGGHRVPYIVRWPGRVKPGTVCNQPVSLMDHLATFAEIAGYRLREEDGADSRSMLPLWLSNDDARKSRRTLVHYVNSATAIRFCQWKMIPKNLGSGGFSKPKKLAPEDGDPEGQLYNLDQDAQETRNVWAEHPGLVEKLTEVLENSQEAKRTLDVDPEM